MCDTHEIPPITDPLGRYWEQPSRDAILVDETHAAMAPRTFDQLSNYSATNPSGVYPGKMWRRQLMGVWLLCWYGECGNPDLCSINTRVVLLLQSEAAHA